MSKNLYYIHKATYNFIINAHKTMLKSFVIVLSYFLAISYTHPCNFNVKIKQTLCNEGFHRNITYGIVFNEDEVDDAWLYQDCMVGLDQTLPPGVFANPDELGDLKRARKLNVIPKSRINVELPAEQASPSSVFVIGELIENKAYLWVPVHGRYHKAVAGGGMARNEIQPPKLFLRCPDERLSLCAGAGAASPDSFLCNGSSRDKCTWKEIPSTMLTDTLIWEVPVGNLHHYYVTAVGTAFVVVVGSLYLLKAVHEYKVAVKKKIS